MSDKELLKLCTRFRNGVLGKRLPKNECFKVAAPLHSYLGFINFKCELVKGYVTAEYGVTDHYWIKLPDNRIIDPTADQFNGFRNRDMPKVYLGEKPDYYMLPNMKKK